jgi:hypothetical protein
MVLLPIKKLLLLPPGKVDDSTSLGRQTIPTNDGAAADPFSYAFCAGEDERQETAGDHDHPHERGDHIAVKVRGPRAGEGRQGDAPGDHNHPHEREGDKYQNSSASPAGDDPPSIGSLRYVTTGPSPAYISGQPPSIVAPGTPIVVLETGRHLTTGRDTAIRVATGDGRTGWMWSSCSREAPGDDPAKP